MLAFSFTVPLTRVAVETFDPVLVSAGRACVAGICALILLAVTRQRRPTRSQFLRLLVIGCGVVAGFPLLTSIALQTAPAAHGAVVIGLLPAATAIAAVIRGRERPSLTFWVAGAAGAVAVCVFASLSNGGVGGLHTSDLLLLGAVVLAAVGYAEGGLLSRELGSWQVICWALVIALPVSGVITVVNVTAAPPVGGGQQWASLAYLSLISMFLGFFAWYRGLAIGPIAKVSQIQLLQPVLTIIWSAMLLGESLSWSTGLGALAVILCAGIAVRARIGTAVRSSPEPPGPEQVPSDVAEPAATQSSTTG